MSRSENIKAIIALAASLLMITAVLLFGSTQANAQSFDPHTSQSIKQEIVIGDIYIVYYIVIYTTYSYIT